jgi:hypothetical protein
MKRRWSDVLVPLVLTAAVFLDAVGLAGCASFGTPAGQAAAKKLQDDLVTLSTDVLSFETTAAPEQLKIVAMIRAGDYLGALASLAVMSGDPLVFKLRGDVDTVIADLRALQGAQEAKARSQRGA